MLTRILAMTLVILVISAPAPAESTSNDNETAVASTFDVAIMDSDCLDSDICEGVRIQHLIEYYGADWCEPCELIEQELSQINESDIFVLQHHPSVVDESFLSESKLRFDQEHRLLFIPSLVIDSKGLLTGSSQALELSNSLSMRTSNYSGLNNISISNGTLHWDSTIGNRLSVWRTDSVEHENRNRTHPTLATDVMQFNSSQSQANISQLLIDFNGTLVVILEQTGTYRLTSDSTNPTGAIDLSEPEQTVDDTQQGGLSPGTQALIWGVVLFALLLPAIYMRWKLSKQPKFNREEE